MKKAFYKSILILALLVNIFTVKATVVTYSIPKGVATSKEYKIELIQNGEVVPTEVYSMNAQFHTNNSKTNSWTTFSFTQKLTIRITRLTQKVGFCQILPRSKKIEVRKSNDYIEFDIEQPGQYSVEFEKGMKIEHPLFIFANAPEVEVPSKSDPNVIYFAPGVHSIGEDFQVKSNQTIYIAGGAYVKGKFIGNGIENVKIIGRGILSSEEYYDLAGTHTIQLTDANNIYVEGITIIYSAHFNLVLKGRNHTVRNVKLLSWWFSSDGIDTGENGIVEDCFLKVNDDAIKLYYSNTIVRRCVIWQLENGAPFQMGWSVYGDNNANYMVYDCDVIRVEHQWDNPNEAAFASILGGGGGRRHYLFENIRIDNCYFRPFHLITQPNRWSGWAEYGFLKDIVFRNIEFYENPTMPSLIRGYNEKHKVSDILFEDLKINGKLIHNADEGNFIIHKPTTENIAFKVTASE